MQVLVLSYNHPELTERTVQSVRSHFSDPEILLIHNGSTVQHQTRLQKKFPGIHHLCMEKNKGFPGGANAGLRKSFETQDWVLFLTNDCQLLQWQKPLDHAPGLIAPLIFARKQGRVDSFGGSFDPDQAHLSHCKSREDFLKAPRKYIPGTAFWIHRDAFDALGGFDESLDMFWEDVDLSVRAAQSGFTVEIDDRTQVLHAIGKTTHKHSHYTTYLFQRNRKRISRKYSTRPWKLNWSLGSSWLQIAWHHGRRGNWDRLKLLARAIRD